MTIRIHPHAKQRMQERGTTAAEIRATVTSGHRSPAKFGRVRFLHKFTFKDTWNGKRYAYKQVEAFAAIIPNGWIVITVIVKYF